MFIYWDDLVAPLMRAAKPKVVVEIGAYTGRNTLNILSIMPPDGLLHAIDPAPAVDIAALDPQRVRLHRALSLDVLDSIGPVDAYIIDGDHNWYSVFHELKTIYGLYADAPERFPLVVLHDTAWPYGRRDMYWDLQAIPAAYRLPNGKKGMVPGQSALAETGGLQADVYNATHEGGARNGVLTAIEDFLAEHPEEFVFRSMPVRFGFGFLLNRAYASQHPEVEQALSALYEPASLMRLLQRQEDLWVEQLIVAQRAEREKAALRQRFEQMEKSGRRPVLVSDAGSIRLSIVVIVYNMRREAPRTLTALTRDYQRYIDDLSYEVIVVENGSSEPLSAAEVEAFGPNFHYHAIADAPTSPARAINFGVEQARGEFVAIMIDGAHILSPGVLHYARQAMERYHEPVITLCLWGIGPAPQGVLAQHGWTQEDEDALFDRIDWPANGYELFLISDAIGETNLWLRAPFETNCLVLRKSLFHDIGGADERFDSPGGGFLNADIYHKAAETEGTQVVSILGEASFHQCHGGTTSSAVPDRLEQLVAEYRQQYAAIRGKEWQFPKIHMEYVGHMPLETRRAGREVKAMRDRYSVKVPATEDA